MSDEESKKLSRRAWLAAWCCKAVGIGIPALVLLSWLIGEAAHAAVMHLGLPSEHTVSLTQWMGAVVLSLLPPLALGASLFCLARCFDGFARQDWFGAKQPKALAATGRWQIIAGALTLVVPTALGLVLSANAVQGERVFQITVSSNGLLMVLFGFTFWSLGLLWEMARDIAAENARFV